MTFLILALMALLAFANGANDNGKGVATLVGYGAARPRPALLWAALTTALGSLFSFWFAGGLITSFSAGLFVEGTSLGSGFFAAVLAGAFGLVILATITGLPVSTTHAITGALTGAGLAAFGLAPLEWELLGAKFALPLAVSPLLSLGLVYLLGWPVALIAGRIAGRCACVTAAPALRPGPAGAAAVSAASLAVVVDAESECAGCPKVAALTGVGTTDALHWLCSGLVGFARGWNDAPKIAALGLVVLGGSGGMGLAFGLVTLAMAAGGLLAGRRVLETLAYRVTPLPLSEAFTASMVTAGLVSLASWHGLPVSTTHVSTGAIIGAGLRRDPRGVRWSTVGEIALSWLVTLPAAALLAGLVWLALR